MVLPASRRVSRVRRYCGSCRAIVAFSPTGLSPSLVGLSRSVRVRLPDGPVMTGPQRRKCPEGHSRFRLFPLRSPLLRESLLLFSPGGTKMFQFAPYAPAPVCPRLAAGGYDTGGCARTQPGCPIRTSPDRRLFGGSPRLIAAYHVLHRVSAPGHPPCTLGGLTPSAPRTRPASCSPLALLLFTFQRS